MAFQVEYSERIQKLPPYLFVEIDKAKRRAREEGRDMIDLGIGDPDQPTPSFIIRELHRASSDPSSHRYALDQGLPELRREIAVWYKARFNVQLDPDTEILPLIGSKEGIAHVPLAFINAHDVVLIPDPCYPAYRSGALFAGGDILAMPLTEENGFLPDLKSINHHLLRKVKMIFLNYPNNPTAATCDRKFLKEVVGFCAKHNIIVCQDAAYSEIAYDGLRSPSILEVDGAKEIAIEFHSLSKTFNMTGWRIGFACGDRRLIAGLMKVKSNIDSGIFTAVQRSGIVALQNYERHIGPTVQRYQERRDTLVDGLRRIGWNVDKPKATFYVWAKVFGRYTSATLAQAMLDKADIVATPGNGFGPHGEGFVRMALTVDRKRIEEAVRRIKERLL
ncbi:MAG: LL-diaminopimelate aminotransferase [Candidatus Omnitrophota bacterium]